jgi:3-oxoacyl-[acyl-carrier protein] reductase
VRPADERSAEAANPFNFTDAVFLRTRGEAVTGHRSVALVTGASSLRGIGAASCVALAADGWDIAFTGAGRDGVSELVERLREAGAAASFLEADLADTSAPARLVDHAETLGPLRALVNCAAHSTRGGLVDMTPEQFDRHMAVNARGTALLSAEFARRFLESPLGGRIVNFVSGPPLSGEMAYAASKGAIEWITFSSAAELASRGITVNAIDPGPTDTGWMHPELLAELTARSPMGRVGTAEDAAGLVAFLASPAGGWITGQVIRADGGWALVE